VTGKLDNLSFHCNSWRLDSSWLPGSSPAVLLNEIGPASLSKKMLAQATDAVQARIELWLRL
jgi:hypothetical protein